MAKIRPQAQSVYGYETPVVSVFPSPVPAFRNPATTDTGYLVGQLWINQTSNQCWIMTSVAAGSAVWALASPGASDVDTLTGDGGGPISPVAGDIILAGGTNITSAGAVNTITFDLDPAITLLTSITSPLYTSTAGTDLQLNAPIGFSTVTQLGDGAGATRFSVTDSTGTEVWGVDSVGAMTPLGALVITGGLTQTAGVVNIGQDNAANAVNIGGGTTARAIGIGNTAAAHILTLGSITGAASTILQSGTGDTLITSTDRITADSVGVLELNSSGAAISIGNDADAFAINVGTGASARVITVGNITGATQVDVNTGTGGSTWTTTNSTFALATGTGAINLGTDAAAKTITVGNGTGASSVVLNCGTGALNVGTNAIAHTVTIGNITGATAVNINSGTAACAWTTTNGSLGLVTGTGAINIGADAAAKTITVGNVTGATAVNFNTGTGGTTHTTTNGAYSLVTGTGAIGIGTDAVAKTLTLGNITGASSVVVDVGTGAASFGASATAHTTTLGSGTGASSTVVNSGTGAASFAANATDHTTTIGSTTGVSATIIQAGSGKIDFAAVVAELTADFVDVSGDKITFRASPIAQSILPSCVIPTGVAATTDLLAFENGMIMEQFIIGTQTLLAPRMGAAALGLTVSCDLTNAEGKEYNFGAARTSSKHSFTIGTSPAFFMELRFTCNDVSSLEPAYFGFRQTEANNAVYTAYNEFCLYGLNDGIAPGDCAISTRKAGGAVVNTDTNDAWADTTTHTLRILVSAAGVVTFMFDGAPPTVTQAFTFTNGIVVHPIWTHLFNATVGAGDEIYWISMECGNQ